MKTSLRILAIACVVFSVAACTVYKQVDQPAEVIFSDDNEIADYLSGYEVFYHTTSGVYNLENVRTSGDTMYGYAVKVDSSRLTKTHKNDMNIYAEDKTPVTDSTLVAIPKSEISKVGLMGRDGRATFLKYAETTASLILIIVIIILAIGLIGVSVWASAASSDGSNASSDQSSGSGSNSGNSGNSSDGSGCYIATMVYGSYEADEVWVLRRFRDNVLQHSRFGRWFITWYYGWSPGFVKKYSKYKFIHRIAKCCLEPIVRILK